MSLVFCAHTVGNPPIASVATMAPPAAAPLRRSRRLNLLWFQKISVPSDTPIAPVIGMSRKKFRKNCATRSDAQTRDYARLTADAAPDCDPILSGLIAERPREGPRFASPAELRHMEIGVFIPIGSNGWLISTTSPQYKPSFELNKQTTLNAERYGLDFVLSMIKLRGFGGKSEFWDHNLEFFTLMAGLAAVTSRIKLYRHRADARHPAGDRRAHVRRPSNSISNGRFGLNVITGWQRPEYSQMGLWPGDEYFGHRYDYAAEYVQILRELWETGVSDLKGEFFTMNDCRLSPRPQADMKIICAGQSDAGLEFTAKHADYNFCFGKGVNTPTACADTVERMQSLRRQDRPQGRVLRPVHGDHRRDRRRGRGQVGALQGRRRPRGAAPGWSSRRPPTRSPAATATCATPSIPKSMVNLNIGLLVGSYAKVARHARRDGDHSGPGGRAADLRRVRQRHRRSSASASSR